VAADRWFEDGESLPGGVEAISLDGFGPGETAFWREGVLIAGDALIHLPPYGFSMLPDKYCADPKKGRESLKKLLRLPVETLAFAHGLPIVANARERLAGLLG
jgi:glyoxylase-like metal-dependent hydrolase (beta-lactamase superfamily II)